MAKSKYIITYECIISVDNLLGAWQDFSRGKHSRTDVQLFELRLMDNILTLHADLANKTYAHSAYHAFTIVDPKSRNIHKASVRDRLLHHALYRVLYPFFDRIFIADSYSCRLGKGTHKAMHRFRDFAYRVSRNHTRTAWALQCDIKKFFASIDQVILMRILHEYIPDEEIRWLLSQIIFSFCSGEQGKGLPLGNLTSQLLVNMYMNRFDQFVKHRLKAKYYIRYADDFMFVSDDRAWLENILILVRDFLWQEFGLQLHPEKVSIRTLASGVDFLGWVHFPDHRVLRTVTKKRMLRTLNVNHASNASICSYLGLLSHGNAWHLSQKVMKMPR